MYEHHCSITVRYAETDQMGVVYHANYLIYFEVARVQAMKALGLRYAELEEQGLGLPVAHLSINYLKSAFYDQTLTLITQIKGIGTNKNKVEMLCQTRDQAGNLLNQAEVVLVLIDLKTRKNTIFPQQFSEKILHHIAEKTQIIEK